MIKARLAFTLLISVVVFINIFWFEDETTPNRNNLFFDPNALLCGKDDAAHDYGVRCLYGDKNSSYYRAYTVSTDADLDPTNHEEVDKVLQSLAYVAVMTGRLVRPRIPIIDEDVFPGSEHIQPWSVVNAGLLRKFGSDAVEPHYWAQAQGVRGHKTRTFDVTLGSDHIFGLSNIVDTMHDLGTSIDEFVFSKKELLAIDSDGVGDILKRLGGHIKDTWNTRFVCSEKVDKVIHDKVDEQMFKGAKISAVYQVKLDDIHLDDKVVLNSKLDDVHLDKETYNVDNDQMYNALYNSKLDDLHLDKLVSTYLTQEGADDDDSAGKLSHPQFEH